jgi:hypothetical protein
MQSDISDNVKQCWKRLRRLRGRGLVPACAHAASKTALPVVDALCRGGAPSCTRTVAEKG